MDFHLTAEHEKIRNVCRELASDFATRAAQHDQETSLPVENYEALKRAGLYSLTVPKELGGWGVGFLGWTLGCEELAQGCPSTAVTFNMHVAGVEWIMDDPIVRQSIRKRVADLSVQDRQLMAAAISEQGTSSLVLAQTFAPSVQARKTKGGYLLRGRKSFLSMIEGCDYTMMTAHPEENPDPLAGLVFIVPFPSEGQHVEAVWDTVGMRGTRSNDLVLADCFVPEENLAATINNYVEWMQTTPAWAPGASITPAYLGIGVAAYRHACDILKQRVPRGFAQPLSYHPDIRRRVAEMSVDVEAARLLMYYTAWRIDTEGKTPAAVAALMRAKYFVGEAVARITRSALTACGAHALFKTSPLERLFRDGASAPIMPPSSDACLNGLGMLELGLNPKEMLPPLKVGG